VQWCDSHTARYGGPGFWVDLPIVVFTLVVPKHVLTRAENKFIPILGTTNKKHNPWRKLYSALTEPPAKRRHRPPAHVTSTRSPHTVQNRNFTPKIVPFTVTMYRVHDTITPDLHVILRYLQDSRKLPATIHVRPGILCLSNRTTCRRLFGHTYIRSTDSVGVATECNLRSCDHTLWCNNDPGSIHVRRVRITQLTYTDLVDSRGGALTFCTFLGKHPTAIEYIKRDLVSHSTNSCGKHVQNYNLRVHSVLQRES